MTEHECKKEKMFEKIWEAINRIGNGKRAWQLAFWILVCVCTLVLPTLTGYVIANDRLRVESDAQIIDRVAKTEALALETAAYRKMNELRLIRIESKIDKLGT